MKRELVAHLGQLDFVAEQAKTLMENATVPRNHSVVRSQAEGTHRYSYQPAENRRAVRQIDEQYISADCETFIS